MAARALQGAGCLWPRWACGKDASSAFATSPLTLRFLDPAVEEAFLQSRQRTMAVNLSRSFFFLAAQVAVGYITHSSVRKEPPNEKAYRIALGVFAFVVAAVVGWERTRQYVGYRACEGVIIGVYLFLAVAPFQAGQHWEQCSWELMLALTLDTVVTLVHLLLPVRWSVIVVPDILYALGYVGHCLRVLGDLSAHPTIAFLSLVLGANLGLRFQEQSERALFALVIDERTLRAKAEFASSTRRPGAPRPRSSDVHSSNSVTTSLPETTSTQQFFTQASQDPNAATLAGMKDLAKREQWLVEERELELALDRVLGSGNLSVVQGRYCGGTVAVKLFKTEETDVDETLFQELALLRHIRHENIALFYGAAIDVQRRDVKLVMERVNGVTLGSFVSSLKHREHEPQAPADRKCVTVAEGLCNALIYLHSRSPRVVHGDLKPLNIMVELPEICPRAKLLDFGISRPVTRNKRAVVGTLRYTAPEVVEDESSSTGEAATAPMPQSDVYAVGLLLRFVATGQHPPARHRNLSVRPAARGDSALLPAWRETIEACTAPESGRRPSMVEVRRRLGEASCEGAVEGAPLADGGAPFGGLSSVALSL